MDNSSASPILIAGGETIAPPTLSVIIPVFNGQGWVGPCLRHLLVAIRAADLVAEILVIDDGSTDGTRQEALDAVPTGSRVDLRVLSQDNLGRFAARQLGLDNARNDFVLFIDTRVFIDPGSLAFVAPLLRGHDTTVWTSHVVAATQDNRIAGFWQAIEHIAWRRYFKNPRTMSFGIDDFDFYPKGTTALIAPKHLLQDAFKAFDPTVADWHKVNDDTAVLRWVAERTPINISPNYSSSYNARTDLKAFLKHAEHRGTVLIDGYLRPGTRFAAPILIVLLATPTGIWFLLRHPLRALGLGIAGSTAAFVGSRRLGVQREDSQTLGALAMPFGFAYLTGMWRGVGLRVAWIVNHRGPRR